MLGELAFDCPAGLVLYSCLFGFFQLHVIRFIREFKLMLSSKFWSGVRLAGFL